MNWQVNVRNSRVEWSILLPYLIMGGFFLKNDETETPSNAINFAKVFDSFLSTKTDHLSSQKNDKMRKMPVNGTLLDCFFFQTVNIETAFDSCEKNQHSSLFP